MASYYNVFRIVHSLADRPPYPVDSMSGIALWNTSRVTGLIVCKSVPKGWCLSSEKFQQVVQKLCSMNLEGKYQALMILAGFKTMYQL